MSGQMKVPSVSLQSSEIDGVRKIHRASFSRDRKYVFLCTTLGFSIFSLTSMKLVSDLRPPSGDVLNGDLVPYSCLACLQTGKRILELWNCETRIRISPSVRTEDEISALGINSKRIFVLTLQYCHVLNLKKLELLHSFDRGEAIPAVSQPLLSVADNGLCAFVVADGVVKVVDSFTLKNFPAIKQHSSSVSAIELADDLLITASVKGTIIRVFQVSSMTLVGLFRRGRTETPIRSLEVSNLGDKGTFLTVTGDSDTAHVFRLPPTDQQTSMVGTVMSFFPTQYKDALEAVRHFGSIKLRRMASGNIARYVAAIRLDGESLAVVSEETGFAFLYDFHFTKGGEFKLRNEEALLAVAGEDKHNFSEPSPQVCLKNDNEAREIEDQPDGIATASTEETVTVEGKKKRRKKRKNQEPDVPDISF